MKRLFVVACILSTVVHLGSVFLGLIVALKAKTPAAFIFSGIMAIIILAMMLCSRDILHKKDGLHRCAKGLWCIAFPVSLCAIWLASCSHVILERHPFDCAPIDWMLVREAGWTQLVTVVICIVFVALSPIGLSFMRKPVEWALIDEEEP